MSDTYQIVFLRAGDGSPEAKTTVAGKIATASKTPVEKLLAQIESAPFVYKKGLPKSKADNISAALNKLGGVTEVSPDGTPLSGASFGESDGGFSFGTSAPAAADGFGFGGAPAAAEPSGFSFGSADNSSPPAPATDDGFGFGAPAAPAKQPDSAPAGGGFDFAAPSPGGDEFAVEEPSGGGFNFSMDAAVSTPSVIGGGSDVPVERNEDFAQPSPAVSAPPVARARPQEATVHCPRCGFEVPDVPECGNCGVLMSKAGSESAPAPRDRSKKKKKKKSSPLVPVLGVVGLVVVAGAAALLSGALNPLRLKLAAGGNDVLKQYGVSLTPPTGPLVEATVTDAVQGKAIVDGYAGASQAIEARIGALAQLDDLAAFDSAASELDGAVQAYLQHPANALRKEVLKVVGPFYPVKGVALGVGAESYMFRDELELADGAVKAKAVPLLSDVRIRRDLEAARKQVEAAQQVRLAQATASRTNVDFTDSFEGALDPRWKVSEGLVHQFNQGWLSLTGSPLAATEAPRIIIEEPLVDYVVELTVSGASDGTHAGLLIEARDGRFVTWGRAAARREQQVQMTTQVGLGQKSDSPRDVRLRITRKGDDYNFAFAELGSTKWKEVTAFRPFDSDVSRVLGITAFGGSASFYIDQFTVTIAR